MKKKEKKKEEGLTIANLIIPYKPSSQPRDQLSINHLLLLTLYVLSVSLLTSSGAPDMVWQVWFAQAQKVKGIKIIDEQQKKKKNTQRSLNPGVSIAPDQ